MCSITFLNQFALRVLCVSAVKSTSEAGKFLDRGDAEGAEIAFKKISHPEKPRYGFSGSFFRLESRIDFAPPPL